MGAGTFSPSGRDFPVICRVRLYYLLRHPRHYPNRVGFESAQKILLVRVAIKSRPGDMKLVANILDPVGRIAP